MKKILGFLMYPFFILEIFFMFFLPFLFTKNYAGFIIFYFLWVLLIGFLMGNLKLMKYYVGFWKRVFNVKYEVIGNGNPADLHSYSIWIYPIILVNIKKG